MKTKTYRLFVLFTFCFIAVPLSYFMRKAIAATVWSDDFESYSLSTFPSAWSNSGNTDAFVTDAESVSGSQSFKLFGLLGQCWGAVAHRKLETTAPFEIEFYVRNGSETLTGCHQNYGGVILNTGPSWTTDGRGVIKFTETLEIRGGNPGETGEDGILLGNYSSGSWYKVHIRYEIIDSATVRLSYWINDEFKGQQDLPSFSFENNLSYISLWAPEGTAWYDDVKIQSGEQKSLDHFLCYKTKSTKGDICTSAAPLNKGATCETEEKCGGTTAETAFCLAKNFPKGLQVRLSDQFETGLFDVQKPVNLCTPADKNDEGIVNPDIHLEAYQIKLAKTVPPQPRHVPRSKISIRNQFHPNGELKVHTIRPSRLLVPTAKSLTEPVEPPDPASHITDHYKCYTVKVSKGIRFTPILGVSVGDQFIDPPKLFDLTKPTRLCTPVDKNNEGINDEDTHLMCYHARPAKRQPQHVSVKGIFVNNQFGPERLDTVTETELCVPSEKILP